MSGFSTDWLSLREPADHAARDNPVTERLQARARAHQGLSILDLGAGTGSNLRFLAPRLGHRQRWRLLDHDPALLAALPTRLEEWAAHNDYTLVGTAVTTLEGPGFSARIASAHADLAGGIDSWLSADATDLVCASALLDLVSDDWLCTVLASCLRHRASTCFTLNYDGNVHWHPALHDDDVLRAHLNAHQQQSKGIGMALGPSAGEAATRHLVDLGFSAMQAASPWQLDARHAKLQVALAEGWVAAAIEHDAGIARRAGDWLDRRRELAVEAGARVTVGHLDVLGLLD